MGFFQLLGILYVTAFAFMYYLTANKGMPPVLPGDIFIRKGATHFYLPTGTSFIIAIVLFVLLKIFFPHI